jgi:cytochrome c oxidase subunit II
VNASRKNFQTSTIVLPELAYSRASMSWSANRSRGENDAMNVAGNGDQAVAVRSPRARPQFSEKGEVLLKKFRWIFAAALAAGTAFSTCRLTASDAPKVIEIHAKRFEFVPSEIKLIRGVPVKLRLLSDDVDHSLVIPELQVNEMIRVGEVSEVLVTPSEAGEFKGVCGKFCGSGHGRMRLSVHVKAE